MTRCFQEAVTHLPINQHLSHTVGQLSAKRARVSSHREVSWSTGRQLEAVQYPAPAHAVEIYLASGSQREPPPGQKQNCSSKLFMSPPHKQHDCTPSPRKWEVLLESGSKHRHCGLGSNRKDWAKLTT